ncbi:MAG: L-threonylcarbamoyladenylate synthase [Gemmatimonadota bacterium]|nr:L-threonylcarbamoyladenylate synthase [Gemmatimonadota bacterium]
MSGPQLVDFRGFPSDDAPLHSVIGHLKFGGLLAYPTETVYGFGGIPDRAVIRGLQHLKGRDASKPMLLLIPDRASVEDLVWTEEALDMAEMFWPGSVTLVLSDPGSRYPEGLRSSEGNVAVRVSPHPLVNALVDGAGPILSTSANLSGQQPALDAQDSLDTARAVGIGEEMWVLDGGVLEPSLPSTVVDCSGSTPTVLREGSIPLGQVRRVLPEINTV